MLRMPWSERGERLAEHGNGEGLCFGILWNDGVEIPQPPVRRALEMTVQAISKAGHKCKSEFVFVGLFLIQH
jgi:amidase